MVRKITEEQEREIVEAYGTKTSGELSKDYHVAASTIRSVWQRNNCKGIGIFNPNTKDFIDRYQNSDSIKDLVDFYKVDRHTITRKAKELGIYKKKEPVLNKEQEQEVIAQYLTASASTLAKKYNVSDSKISQVWMQAGLRGKQNRTYYLNEHYFDDITTDEQAYWLGFIASDGCIHSFKDNRQDTLSFSLQTQDFNHLEKFKKALNTDKPLFYGMHGEQRQYTQVTLQISSNILCNALQKYGITYNKTYDVQWPNIHNELLPAYIRGYFDGDGTIRKHFKPNELYKVGIGIVGFENNMMNFQNYLKSQNIESSLIYDNRPNKYTRQDFCQLILTNKTNKYAFLRLIYNNATVYLDRKYVLAQQFISYYELNPTSWSTKHTRRT